jgi:predicted nucleic acid-binding protein
VRVALDTNVLAYAEGTNGAEMKEAALRLIHRLPVASIVLPVQALGELFNVLVLKAKRPATNARAAILGWRDAYAAIDTSSAVMLSAADLATDHRLRIWDAVILSASAEAGCRLLLSEDLQEGFTWRGVTVTNPFSATPHALLKTLLSDERDEIQKDDR